MDEPDTRAPIIDGTNYIGIDLHSNNIVVCVMRNGINKTTGSIEAVVKWKGKISLEPGLAEVAKKLTPFMTQPHKATVESTYNWYGLADLFEKKGWNLVLADPTTVKANKDKFTDDRTDAEFLADRMRLNDLRTATIMPCVPRAFRDMVRLRAHLSMERARHRIILINMINNQCYEHVNRRILDLEANLLAENNDVDCILGSCLPHHFVNVKAASHLRIIQAINDEMVRVEEEIKKAATDLPQNCHKYLGRLMSIKGCGPIISLIIASEIHDIGRFKTAAKFVSYCRLAPSSRLSNGRVKGEGNAKNGNAYLSWVMTELANMVVRYNPAAKRKFDRLLRKRAGLRCRAIRPIAAMLARAIFYMLRDDVDFDSDKLFGPCPAKEQTKVKTMPEGSQPEVGG